MVLAGDEEDHETEVSRRVAHRRTGTDLPLAADLERHVARRAVADVGERHDDDLASRFRLHVGDHRVQLRERGGVEHAREVVDVAAGRGDRDLLQAKEQRNKGGNHRARESYVIRAVRA